MISLYKYCSVDILALVSEAEKTLNNHCYFAAFSMAFALMSKCAVIEYPDDWFSNKADTDDYLKVHFPNKYKNGKYAGNRNHDAERFCMWWDDWDSSHNLPDDSLKDNMIRYEIKREENRRNDDGSLIPMIDGELLYKIRCAFLHEASNDVDCCKLHDEGNNKIDKIYFVVDELNPMSYGGTVFNCMLYSNEFHVYVQGLVRHILHRVRLYCARNKSSISSCINVIDVTGTYFSADT